MYGLALHPDDVVDYDNEERNTDTPPLPKALQRLIFDKYFQKPAKKNNKTQSITTPLPKQENDGSKMQDEFFPNKRRISVVKEYNFVMVESDTSAAPWKFNAKSFGPKQVKPFFDDSFTVNR